MERAGRKVKQLLQKNDPFKESHCGSDQCFVCSTTGRGRCRRNGINYKIRCKEVGECGGFEYGGETFKNGFSRGGEHCRQYRAGTEGSVMRKHIMRHHGGREVEFKMEITEYVRNDGTLRQVTEAVRINQIPEERRMNDQTEWNIARIPRLAIEM